MPLQKKDKDVGVGKKSDKKGFMGLFKRSDKSKEAPQAPPSISRPTPTSPNLQGYTLQTNGNGPGPGFRQSPPRRGGPPAVQYSPHLYAQAPRQHFPPPPPPQPYRGAPRRAYHDEEYGMGHQRQYSQDSSEYDYDYARPEMRNRSYPHPGNFADSDESLPRLSPQLSPPPTFVFVPAADLEDFEDMASNPQWLHIGNTANPRSPSPFQRPITPQAPWTVTTSALQPSDDEDPIDMQRLRYMAPSPSPSMRKHGMQYTRRVSESDSESDTEVRRNFHRLSVYPPQALADEPPAYVESEEDESILHVDLNARYRSMPDRARPVWYRKDNGCEHTVVEGSDDFLCGTCRRIDFVAILNQEETDQMPSVGELIVLGPYAGIMTKSKDCGFCSLVTRIALLEPIKNMPLDAIEEERRDILAAAIEKQMNDLWYLYPVRFKTEYSIPALYLCRNAWQTVQQASGKGALIKPDRNLGLRLMHRNQPRLGRLVKKDVMDFEWIKERLTLCDQRSVKAPYRHRVTLRAIDVVALRVVDLEPGARYVALSYVWGQAKQLKLTKSTKASFQGPAGLAQHLKTIPKTIRDAIKLTLEIGEEYLWVDALCIVQDDDEDKMRQINEMGNIYHEAVLVIQACCGNDATYGLPGVDPGTRKVMQVAEKVGHLVLSNMLPGEEHIDKSLWAHRAWTMQEKILSRRMLMITDEVVWWWCWHSCSPEDEHCRHPYWEDGTRDQDMIFFSTEHDLVLSKRGALANFDLYAYILADYTRRNMSCQGDAENALRGISKRLEGYFRGNFVHGLPSTEFDNGLLWAPIGTHTWRIGDNGKPLFPSWSWLGWIGHVAYPWAVERCFPSSTLGSPLKWIDPVLDAMPGKSPYFTSELFRMSTKDMKEGGRSLDDWVRDPDDAWCYIEKYGGAHHYLHPIVEEWVRPRPFRFTQGSSHQLRLSTLAATFTLGGTFFERKDNYNHLHTVYQMRILDSQGFSAGYIYTSDPETMTLEQVSQHQGQQEFIILSRASLESNPDTDYEFLLQPIESLASSMRMPRAFSANLKPSPVESLNKLAYFDEMVYYASSPWCIFNVMMIEWKGNVAFRVAVGRIHVGAFMSQAPVRKEIKLE